VQRDRTACIITSLLIRGPRKGHQVAGEGVLDGVHRFAYERKKHERAEPRGWAQHSQLNTLNFQATLTMLKTLFDCLFHCHLNPDRVLR